MVTLFVFLVVPLDVLDSATFLHDGFAVMRRTREGMLSESEVQSANSETLKETLPRIDRRISTNARQAQRELRSAIRTAAPAFA